MSVDPGGPVTALFDVPREWITASSRAGRPAPYVAPASLADLAFLYTGTELGACSGIRFAMSVEDARAWCSSPMSSGRIYTTRWSYFWTSAVRFLAAYPPPLDLTGYVDSGEWDERITDLGLTKIALADLPEVLAQHGVAVTGAPPAPSTARTARGES